MPDITYIANISARQNGYTLDENQLTSDVAEMVHFELLLTEIRVKNLDSEYYNNKKRMTIEELQKYYNNFNITAPPTKIDFLEIIQHMCNEANVHVNSSEPILVYNLKFLHQLVTLLGNTSQRTLVNYIQWNMVKKFMLIYHAGDEEHKTCHVRQLYRHYPTMENLFERFGNEDRNFLYFR